MIDEKIDEKQVLQLTEEISATLNINTMLSPMHKVVEASTAILSLGLSDSFIEFIEARENRIELNYKTGYQKFVRLYKEYKLDIIDVAMKRKMSNLEKHALELSEKVEQLKNVFEEHEYKRISGLTTYDKSLDFHNITKLFRDNELKILNQIGSLRQCLSMIKSKSGTNTLIDKILKITKQETQRAIVNKAFPRREPLNALELLKQKEKQ